MRGTRRQVVAVLLLVAAVAAAGTARADESRGAKGHYEKGTALYDLGQYREAAREYEEAFKLKPVAALLFNIAQAYRLAGDEAAALRAYRGYLRRDPQAANRGEVEGYIGRLEQSLEDKRRAAVAPAPSAPAVKAEPAKTAVVAAPAPATVAPPASAAAAAVTATPAKATPERTPAYKKWWVWTIVGGVVAAGVGVGVGLALTQPKDVTIPGDAHTVRF